mmetsp:Transcript_26524/g.36492  ORF Transcript_26524/g.36492 Transcript_26524/m.36492 type:complete len:113 (-) Transcript_26524:1029-1367(-)
MKHQTLRRLIHLAAAILLFVTASQCTYSPYGALARIQVKQVLWYFLSMLICAVVAWTEGAWFFISHEQKKNAWCTWFFIGIEKKKSTGKRRTAHSYRHHDCTGVLYKIQCRE